MAGPEVALLPVWQPSLARSGCVTRDSYVQICPGGFCLFSTSESQHLVPPEEAIRTVFRLFVMQSTPSAPVAQVSDVAASRPQGVKPEDSTAGTDRTPHAAVSHPLSSGNRISAANAAAANQQ